MTKYIRIATNDGGVDPKSVISWRYHHQEPNPPEMWLHTLNGDLAVESSFVPTVYNYFKAKTRDI